MEDDLGVASALYWKPPQLKGLTQIIRILEKKFNKKRPFARILEFILIVGPYISINRPYRAFEWDPNPRKEVVTSFEKLSRAGTEFS